MTRFRKLYLNGWTWHKELIEGTSGMIRNFCFSSSEPLKYTILKNSTPLLTVFSSKENPTINTNFMEEFNKNDLLEVEISGYHANTEVFITFQQYDLKRLTKLGKIFYGSV